MPLSAAEKQRRYRQKRDLDQNRRNEYLKKQKEKYIEEVALGKRKKVADMSDRTKRKTRKLWRKKKAEYRKKRKEQMNKEVCIPTPESSPSHNSLPGTNHRGEHMSKEKKRKIAKCYRDNAGLRTQLEAQKSINQKLKKRLERVKNRQSCSSRANTPRSKTKILLRNFGTTHMKSHKEKIRKTLFHHFTLTEQLRNQYKMGKKIEKAIFARVITGNLMRKYNLINAFRKDLGFFSGRNKIQKIGCLTFRMKKKIQSFFERDDNSRLTSGIKDTVSKYKLKKQRRVLLTTIELLHNKFLMENTDVKISYTSFCRSRPFWVLPPKEGDRDTCLCKQHENMQFLCDALHKQKLLETSDLHKLVSGYSCDIKNIDCMYGRCTNCQEIRVPCKDVDNNREVKWFKWQTVKEKRLVKKIEKEVSLTVKVEESGDISGLKDTFSEGMVRFKQHFFNISNQIHHYRQLKEQLSQKEALIHIDFSENYEGKMAREIQSVHFGASKHQITLHTGVYYTSDRMETFCAVSDSLEHGPSGIWAYLDPILDRIFKENENIDTLHFYSDGPSTQYKQKANFFLLSREVENRGLKLGTWNFYESGHGKGVPDGVGGSLKRTANSMVLQGHDIKDASDFVEIMKGSAVFVFKVTEEEVSSVSRFLESKKLRPIPGTYKMHQIKTFRLGEIWYRDISCTCEEGFIHSGHDWKFFNISNDGKKTQCTEKTSRKQNKSVNKENTEKHNQSDVVQQNDRTECIDERMTFFASSLEELAKCSGYAEIERKSISLNESMNKYNINYEYIPSIMNTGLQVDEDAMDIYPSDTIQQQILFPVKVKGDGNCLPYTGSIHGFGNDKYGTEIRVRIVVEAVMYKHLYLSHDYLNQGNSGSPNLPKAFAMYSDEYTPPSRLGVEDVEEIYKKEIVKITNDKTFMGIWQLFALASILGRRVFSVYPQLGNQIVRTDLHRIIEPRVKKVVSEHTGFIMWSSTRKDLTNNNWVPNHFVAVLPIAEDEVLCLKIQRWKLMRQRKLESDRRKKSEHIKDYETETDKQNKHEETLETKQEGTKETQKETGKMESSSTNYEYDQDSLKQESSWEKRDGETVQMKDRMDDTEHFNQQKNEETYTIRHDETETILDNQANVEDDSADKDNDKEQHTTEEYISPELLQPDDLIGRYVIVRYDQQSYPGIVLDSDETEVYIRCMHRVGKSIESYMYYWPKAVKDECWYRMEDVLAVIPEPTLVNRKYQVKESLWTYINEIL